MRHALIAHPGNGMGAASPGPQGLPAFQAQPHAEQGSGLPLHDPRKNQTGRRSCTPPCHPPAWNPSSGGPLEAAVQLIATLPHVEREAGALGPLRLARQPDLAARRRRL